MPRAPRRYWHEMTTRDFGTLDKDRAVAVLPVGAIEQHGPHLPVYVDACINQGLIEATLARLPEELPVLVLPMQSVGKSNEHIAFPGTLTLSAETLLHVCMEIGESVHRAGIRRLVLFNSHGGQPQVMEIAARELRVRLAMFAVTVSWWQTGYPPGLIPPEELRNGIHAGTVETAMMLHLRPELVRMELAQAFISTAQVIEQENRLLRPLGGVGFGWQAQDLNEHGACGDASAATAELGRQIVEYAAGQFAQLLAEVSRYPLQRLRDGPAGR